ncbi:hypothetical protein HET69_05685 [Streptomyces sp. CJ_13]|uniref:hypothetical protein n=1 Tax=Streptomyces TaxID=1883 RepID=UPI001BDBDA4C|nr:hypothetical protein [Streptomyces sp. CJ_13]MBT1183512.1 hypothetical protein [Streptomyces sp. CJ_13]
MRPRIHHSMWPRPALILTDTPDPNCVDCQGQGGHNHDYGDHDTGEYSGTEWESCHCWDETRRWTLLPLPRLSRPKQASPDPWSDEPPF